MGMSSSFLYPSGTFIMPIYTESAIPSLFQTCDSLFPGKLISGPHHYLNRFSQVFWQLCAHVLHLVLPTSLNQVLRAVHLVYCFSQSFRSVDYKQSWPIWNDASLLKILQQPFHHRGILFIFISPSHNEIETLSLHAAARPNRG